MAKADRGGFQRQEVITYTYLLLNIALSSGQIFFNKWVLSSKEINFPDPLGLTLLHMVFSSLLCFLLTKVFKVFRNAGNGNITGNMLAAAFFLTKMKNSRLQVMKVEQGMTEDIYTMSVIPIGAMFAMTLWLGNAAYLYISVVFAQMLKAISVLCLWSYLSSEWQMDLK